MRTDFYTLVEQSISVALRTFHAGESGLHWYAYTHAAY